MKFLRVFFTTICSLTLGSAVVAMNAKGVVAPIGAFRSAPQTTPAEPHPPPSATGESSQSAHFTLSPEKRAKAIAYARARHVLYFFGVAFSLGSYIFLWRARIALTFRRWAQRISSRRFVQCLIFGSLLFGTVSLIDLPLEYYAGFVLEHRFGLSTQGIASWMGDWMKALAISMIVGVVAVWILYEVIRRSPRRWWFYFWLVSVPLSLGLILIQPVVIDPLFYKFTPLETVQPALTARIEVMLHHAGLEIPSSRIFEMNASMKTKAVNAYVNGIGASKRVVVWDTTLRLMDPDETLLVLGHETGHYVLGHIVKGFVFFELGALVAFAIGFVVVDRIIKRQGRKTGLDGVGDLASLPILLLVLTALSFLSSPIYCGVSRHIEHQADKFSLEVAYGVVPDPNAAEVRALQTLGEQDLEEPDPSPFIKFWLYTHPPLDERIRFAATYKPWAEGKPLELLNPK